jgi:hypothetical protein
VVVVGGDTELLIMLKYLRRLRSGTQSSQPIAAININIIKPDTLHYPILRPPRTKTIFINVIAV